MHKEEDEVNKHLSQLSVPSLAEAGAVSTHLSRHHSALIAIAAEINGVQICDLQHADAAGR